MTSAQVDVEQHVRRLETAVNELLRLAEGSPEALYAVPASDEWSIMKVLAHVAELVPYWARQARQVASRAENNQPFGRTHDDPDRIAAVENHGDDPLEVVAPRVRSGLDEAILTLRSLDATGWARTGRHARRGEMTVEQIVDQFLVSHAEEHLHQAREVLGRIA